MIQILSYYLIIDIYYELFNFFPYFCTSAHIVSFTQQFQKKGDAFHIPFFMLYFHILSYILLLIIPAIEYLSI